MNGLNAGLVHTSVPSSVSQHFHSQHSPGSQQQQHRLSGQSYESGVSGVSSFSSARQSYHSNSSSSSLGSLDRLEESGSYACAVNVHQLIQAGVPVSKPLFRYLWLLIMMSAFTHCHFSPSGRRGPPFVVVGLAF